MIIKIGPKKKHLKVPDNCTVVTSGKCRRGDFFANVGNPNSTHWSGTTSEDWGMDWDFFECLIRSKGAVGHE